MSTTQDILKKFYESIYDTAVTPEKTEESIELEEGKWAQRLEMQSLGRQLPHFSEAEQLEQIAQFPEVLEFIEEPNKKWVEAGILAKPEILSDQNVVQNIEFALSDPKFQLSLVQKNPAALAYYDNMNEWVQATLVNQDPNNIEFIKNPTSRVREFVVRENPDAIEKFQTQQDDETYIRAFVRNPKLMINYIQHFAQANKPMDKDMEEYILDTYPQAFIDADIIIPEDIQIALIKKDPEYILKIKALSAKAQQAAINAVIDNSTDEKDMLNKLEHIAPKITVTTLRQELAHDIDEYFQKHGYKKINKQKFLASHPNLAVFMA